VTRNANSALHSTPSKSEKEREKGKGKERENKGKGKVGKGKRAREQGEKMGEERGHHPLHTPNLHT
jgi:hypothetical protein